MGDILRYPEKWSKGESSNGCCKQAYKHAALGEAVYIWMCDMTARNAALSDEMVILKAKQLGKELGVENFEYSLGWLTRFKKRKGIQQRILEGEARRLWAKALKRDSDCGTVCERKRK
ncbi:hypothetical protein CAPTEDRAFT_194445 [Capitella teleta]|uniref:HTH CENPB-type domain-containing protein n=1 Tax=Capitella teleta TaxID=283909 RepID=R7UL14_CAPTE|nr:hypothetical protein CAPTEDRAFT_194445 [Capitella teleta]|eukprot:ELU06803.1 hypothetical protein CAPTEDRAFT_194445 [Capitella teleta]